MATAVPAPERVLPTLNPDGSRNRIRPKPFRGRFFWARFAVAWALLATFITLPFVEIGGQPAMLLDIAARRFVFFGATFLATDGVLLMLLLLAIFVGILLLSAVLGRAWCGWGCPQTVYMEFVFRPLEQLLEGTRSQQMALDRRGANGWRVLKLALFVVLSLFLANIFVSYFVGMRTLYVWVLESPLEHPAGFLTMLATAGLVFLDFGYFREQMCSVACPYARLQSALLDRHSLVIGYDAQRGEPRARKPQAGDGDCIDCNNCVVACPTGIDIRNGLQLDCIACAQCVDACDWVMKKLDKPVGLVRYGSQESLEARRPTRYVRPRVIAYSAVILAALVALVGFQVRRGTADVTVLRGLGTPYVVDGDEVRNLLRVKIENRSGRDQRYSIEVLGVEGAKLVAPENPVAVRAGTHQTTNLFVVVPRSRFVGVGAKPIEVRVTDGDAFDRKLPYQLLGPRWAPGGAQ